MDGRPPAHETRLKPLVEAAADYINAGLAIIALNGKLPNSAIHPHGLREPMSGSVEEPDDWATLIRVFTHAATTGVGIVIQHPYVVVDIDGEDGAVQLRDLLGTATLDDTPIARTARGLHVWYANLDATPQRTTKLGAKLDLKGEGGYVAAPPSLHPEGHVYEWLIPLAPAGVLRPPMQLPEPLEAFLAAQRRLADDYRPLRPSNQPASLEPLVRHVRLLAEGNRNNGLHWAASAAAEDGFAFAEAAPKLLDAAMQAGLDRLEAMTAIRSGFRSKRAG